MTILYSILHLLVDGLCAMAMFGRYIPLENGYFYILLYNFCAFALQMPFGVLLDALNAGKKSGKHGKPDLSYMTVVLGVLCTIAGAATHPVVLGIGNALFHVGGGVGTICEDRGVNGRGMRLGIFVAPGALGLYLGTMAASGSGSAGSGWSLWYYGTSISMLVLLAAGKRHLQEHLHKEPEIVCGEKDLVPHRFPMGSIRLTVCCLLVVTLRSYIGMAVGFPWKTGILAGLLSVLALVGGKMTGGILGAWQGTIRTAVVSLLMGSVCYLFSSVMPIGLAALFLFNMTMPITLYWMICAYPKMPGFAFGFLTFGLFLGFLPGYFGLQSLRNGSVTGCLGSLLSLLLLSAGAGNLRRGCDRKHSVPPLSAAGLGKRSGSEKLSD